MNKYNIGETDIRIWGHWEVLEIGDNFCIKRLTFNPNKRISKQKHKHRNEIWIIVSGFGRVLIGDNYFEATPGRIFTIKKETLHQVQSFSEGLTIIELQLGDILDENDIERFYH